MGGPCHPTFEEKKRKGLGCVPGWERVANAHSGITNHVRVHVAGKLSKPCRTTDNPFAREPHLLEPLVLPTAFDVEAQFRISAW